MKVFRQGFYKTVQKFYDPAITCVIISRRAGALHVLVLLTADGTGVDCVALLEEVAFLVISGLDRAVHYPAMASGGDGLSFGLVTLGTSGRHLARRSTGGVCPAGLRPGVVADGRGVWISTGVGIFGAAAIDQIIDVVGDVAQSVIVSVVPVAGLT